MWTYDIIFPADDRRAQSWLSKEIRAHSLDTMLSRRPINNSQIHDSPQDISTPRDVSSLCSKHPYWGRRLYNLWREVNDPSPVESRVEAFFSPLTDWVCANPATAWVIMVIAGVKALIADLVSAIFTVLQWAAARNPPAEQIIMLPDFCNPVKWKQKQGSKVNQEQKEDCKDKVNREQKEYCINKVKRELKEYCKVYEDQEKKE